MNHHDMTRNMVLAALFAALTAIGAFLQIPTGTVPITLQFLFTALAGLLLGWKWGAVSQLLYKKQHLSREKSIFSAKNGENQG